MATGIREKLEVGRRELLDLSARNRLVNTPRNRAQSGLVEVVDEQSHEVFRRLVGERKAMSFLPTSSASETETNAQLGLKLDELTQPVEEEIDQNGTPLRHVDDRLQTRLTSERLQKKLLKTYYDARTFEEEQGVNILYLALGFLKWFEADSSDREHHAPLILVPVALDRQSATSRFKVRYTEDDITTNLSLQEKLKAEFGMELPDIPDAEDSSPNDYFAAVKQAVSPQPRWELLPNDIVLGFFSFAKFLMYRDLSPDAWPEDSQLDQQQLITSLLLDGFRSNPPFCDEDDNLDRLIQPIDMIHVTDADSSQAVAIEEVKRGRNLVIQGPPGTGKSQTITNLIAAAVKAGKKVLFVAEKMAALEVVKRRLANIGLGDICLELHSHKANKRAVFEELSRTLALGRPKVTDVVKHADELKAYRDKLNRHAELMHTVLEPSQITPYQIIGELVRLRAKGVKPASFRFTDPVTWTATSRREKMNMLTDLADHMAEIGNPKEHPWRGVELDAVLPTDIERITAKIPDVLGRLDRLIGAAAELADIFSFGSVVTAQHVAELGRLARRIEKVPAGDRKCLADGVWGERRSEIDSLLQRGKTFTNSQSVLAGIVAEVAWSTDVAATRQAIAAHGRSWFRILNRSYRQAMARLRGILCGPPPKYVEERLHILDTLITGQRALNELTREPANQELGHRAFGDGWHGCNSNWSALGDMAAWEADCRAAELPPKFRLLAASMPDPRAGSDLLQQIRQDLKPFISEVKDLFQLVRLNLSIAFGVKDVRAVPLEQLRSRLSTWQSGTEALTKWIAYCIRRKWVAAAGMAALADQLDQGLIAATAALDSFEMAYFEELMREVFRCHPELAEFDGVSHERLRSKFQSLDVERLRLARQEVAMAHFLGLPLAGGDVGEVGIVRREINKKRRHLPLRKLVTQAGRAVQAIKPVFMMSPISVAQYLEPGCVGFDLLLIDEASQVRPVDALGAIARAKQIVVVGDDRQLPPTRFFTKLLDEGTDEERADEFQAGDLESILGLCLAQSVPQRMLRWHYRSLHHSLIAVSNREFYGDRLFIVPSPMSDAGAMGVKFRKVADGVFDRGGSATNRIEARAVADAVIEHARKSPNKTLGVGSFSAAQRDAILDDLELRRRAEPVLEPFFATSTAEPFFVKNLENIQGDERDVIFISVGYGRDASGYMAMNFGPLSVDGGERRLNVLITRARERCEVFSSITADDIDLNRGRSRGVQAFKTFLTYAQRGHLDVQTESERDYASEFEREVARAIASHGYKVDTQVGVGGFFVDLAIVDPHRPGRYLLGIECDGATYHSSRSARDRDRLRQQVLEDRGWIIHRIWSTDWFHRPDEQLRKALAAIENAKADWTKRENDEDTKDSERTTGHSQTEIHRTESATQTEVNGEGVQAVPYQEAALQVTAPGEIHEVPATWLAQIVRRVVQIEGPIHADEIARRIASLWGLSRTGSRIVDAVNSALRVACLERVVVQDGDFFSPPGRLECLVRNRELVQSSNLRKPEYLPPAEIRAAIMAVARVHLGVSHDEAIVETARLFGFKSTSSQLRDVITREINQLVQAQSVEQRNGKLYCT